MDRHEGPRRRPRRHEETRRAFARVPADPRLLAAMQSATRRAADPSPHGSPGRRLRSWGSALPHVGGDAWAAVRSGVPRFSTRGPVTAPELLSQALRYGEEPSRNRPASRSPCAARRPRTACCPSADGEPARPVLARRSRPKVLGARGGPAASAALLPLTQPSQDRKGPGPHRRSQTGANRCAHHGPRTRSSSPRGDHVGNLCFPGREVAVTSNPNPEPSSSQLSGTSNSRVRDLNEPRLTGAG